MTTGYLNLVLHAHLPFVRHLDRDDRLEERWLFEALTETYIPLLQTFHKLVEEGVDFHITVSLSPPLVSMLADPLLQARYQQHLETLLELAECELKRTKSNQNFYPLAQEYQRRFQNVKTFFESYNGNVLTAFADLFQRGNVELITSSATHAFLPYLLTDEALRAQIATAVQVFRDAFGIMPAGMWLPECAYTPRVAPILREFSIRYFFVDNHAFSSASPAPVFGTYAPLITQEGIAAFARDEECSRQVWSSDSGYPGDYDYREYYRDIGYDADAEYIRPFIHPDGIRLNTGFKYYRITGEGAGKQPYDFNRARAKAAEHAGNFMYNRQQQAAYMHGQMGRTPVITAPYDAELFGHWWYEGPVFLDMLLRKVHYDQTDITTITPSQYLTQYSDFQSADLSFSTWGRAGYGEVWCNETNDWVYPALHDAELRIRRLAQGYGRTGTSTAATAHRPAETLVDRALQQLARELLLAQSSDWAFIMDTKSSVDYAVRRTKQHLNRFRLVADMIEHKDVDVRTLESIEEIDNLFPQLDIALYQSSNSRQKPNDAFPMPLQGYTLETRTLAPHTGIGPDITNNSTPRLRILVLSWEFPPMSVGGLSRHVYDLTRSLVASDCEIHVVTTAIGDYPLDEVVEGVHVHRVRVLQPDGDAFIHFAFQLNLMMMDRCETLVAEEQVQFDLIHAHDWLVEDAAAHLKHKYQLPLVATIHATEHGRNHGIFTDTQRHIHHHEWKLTYEAKRVIVCSSYMEQEVLELFQLPQDKVDILPNGVDEAVLRKPLAAAGKAAITLSLDVEPYARAEDRIILFVGRLVREKGVHVLLDALPAIRGEVPNVKCVIVGKGPMFEQLQTQTHQLGLDQQVVFTGYVDDDTRNRLLMSAEVAVFPSLYEPFGIVALEAMAARVPVVVSDVGGLRDIVEHNRNGLMVYANDPRSITTQVSRVLRDKQFAAALVDEAERRLRQFDWTTIASATRRIYEQALE